MEINPFILKTNGSYWRQIHTCWKPNVYLWDQFSHIQSYQKVKINPIIHKNQFGIIGDQSSHNGDWLYFLRPIHLVSSHIGDQFNPIGDQCTHIWEQYIHIGDQSCPIKAQSCQISLATNPVLGVTNPVMPILIRHGN